MKSRSRSSGMIPAPYWIEVLSTLKQCRLKGLGGQVHIEQVLPVDSPIERRAAWQE